ncbi:nicotinic acid mononucleotide adenylyltransferase [Paenibacillus shirakamiensis]|uniref:Nicotinic acid mononucleotide adenylyltransferase n=1 Tax=Paenibacillus shirakamiensis TaxID=1265935 RepID=A0ABS4JF71_9BACL|nr:hypothetical protein [Paenibacillus shirakamiensis]MBP2000348.1 nicotinic acid mononucleotide adenylyltransferase [Paenibacillus shirakamiensis]
MPHEQHSVPFGYEPQPSSTKGTLIFYDSFEQIRDEQLAAAVEARVKLDFGALVLYPLHEETVRRMSKEPVVAYHKREQRLFDWRAEIEQQVTIENWEGKRKKYTPFEAAMRHLSDKYKAPFFVYVSFTTLNKLASYSSFEEWVTKVRFLVYDRPRQPHPRLEKYRHRWDTVTEAYAKREA